MRILIINIQLFKMATNSDKPKLRVENISCVIPQTELLGGLFLGNGYGAQNPDILKQYGIRAVLTTSIQTPLTYNPTQIPFHLKIAAHDKNDFEIIQHLEQCIEFIHKYRQITNVFVHCYAGVSRSVTVVVAYIMKFWKWGLVQALAFVQAKRVVAKPNDGFMMQLKKFEENMFSGANRPNSMLAVQSARLSQPHPRQNSMTIPTHPSFQFSTQLKRPEQVIPSQNLSATKRHSEIPIPRILSSKGGDRKQQQNQSTSQPLYQRYQQTSNVQPSKTHPNVQYSSTNNEYGTTSAYSKTQPNGNNIGFGVNSQYGYGHGYSSSTVASNNMSSNNRNSYNNSSSNGNTHNIYNSNANNSTSIGKNSSNINNQSQSTIQNVKSAKMLIRPKDLPGYRG